MTSAPPGWPVGVPPPGTTEDWAEDATRWLLEAGPGHFRHLPVLMNHPIVLARRVVEHLTADLAAAREAWVPDAARWTELGLPAEAHQDVLVMLSLEGPRLAVQVRSATLVKEALTDGRRWRPRL